MRFPFVDIRLHYGIMHGRDVFIFLPKHQPAPDLKHTLYNRRRYIIVQGDYNIMLHNWLGFLKRATTIALYILYFIRLLYIIFIGD